MPKRLCIYPKDIQLLTGRSERYARNYLRTMKDALGKQPHQFVTIQEFCEYADLSIDAVIEQLKL